MKGLVLTYIVTVLATVGALRYPLIGLYVYVSFAILRPQNVFGWAGDLENLSMAVGTALLIGWLLNGFGSWKLGRARAPLALLLLFFAWSALSALQALEPQRSWNWLVAVAKVVVPLVAGLTLMREQKHWRWLVWTIVLSQGYVSFEMNLDYLFKGYNTAAIGFGGMDNNFFGLSLVTVLGLAVALTVASRTWRERLAAGASAALILHTILLTFSRGAMVGMLAVGATAFVMMPKRPRYLAALLITLLVAIRFTGPELAERYRSAFAPAEERDGSSESRIQLWRDCLLVVASYPVFGVGPANWRVISSSFGWPEGKSAHSVWMETAAENGIPGMLLLLGFFGLAARRLWPIARGKLADTDPYEQALAMGAVLAIVGFVVTGQFVSASSLETPYYVTMAGLTMIRLKTAEGAVRVAPVPRVAPVSAASRAVGEGRARAGARPVRTGGLQVTPRPPVRAPSRQAR